MSPVSPVGKTRDAGWQIGVSRTVPGPVDEVWDLLTSPRGLARWLGVLGEAGLPRRPGTPYETAEGTTGELRSFRPLDRVRLTWQPPGWDHDSTVQVAVRGDGERTLVRFHQERLADAAERERQRDHWSAVMDRLVADLGVDLGVDPRVDLRVD